MPRSNDMTIYGVFDMAGGEYVYFHTIKGAEIYAKTAADELKRPVEVIAYIINMPNKRKFVAALNGSHWCVKQWVRSTIAPRANKRRT